MKQRRIVIVGGGYGSLATAALFAKKGDAVTVIEKNGQLGGRAGQLQQDGFRFDTGPSWYLMPEVFERYYSLFGKDVAQELELTRLTPGYSVFFQSHDPLIIKGNLDEDAKTFESIEPGSGEKLRSYVKQSQRIYTTSVDDILYNTYRNWRWVAQKKVLSLLPEFGIMATRTLDSHVSRSFNDIRLKQILEYHSVFLGTSPFNAPAIYSLMSTLDFVSGVYYPKNGMYTLVESLVQLGTSLGVTYMTNAPVDHIAIENGTATGVTLTSGTHIEADIVISGADLHHTETRLVEAQYQSYPEKYWKKKQPSPSALLVSLGIKGELPQLSHHNLYFVDDWKENFEAIYTTGSIPKNASLYICRPGATDPTAAPDGYENIFILVPLPAHRTLSEQEREELTHRSIAQLGTLVGESDIAARIVTQDIVDPKTFQERFHAWGYNSLGGQSHLLSQSAFFRTRNKSKKVQNLYYVGAGTNPGIGLPMCLISAQIVYKMIEGITDTGPLTHTEGEGSL